MLSIHPTERGLPGLHCLALPLLHFAAVVRLLRCHWVLSTEPALVMAVVEPKGIVTRNHTDVIQTPGHVVDRRGVAEHHEHALADVRRQGHVAANALQVAERDNVRHGQRGAEVRGASSSVHGVEQILRQLCDVAGGLQLIEIKHVNAGSVQCDVAVVGVDGHGIGHEPVVKGVVNVPVEVQDLARAVDLDGVLVDQPEAHVAESLCLEILVAVVERVSGPAGRGGIGTVADDATSVRSFLLDLDPVCNAVGLVGVCLEVTVGQHGLVAGTCSNKVTAQHVCKGG